MLVSFSPLTPPQAIDSTILRMTPEDLSDRLVVATEEQDVLYVLHWLSEMKEEKCLESAINSKHSWKGYSALESLIQSPFSTIRKIILEILLLQGIDGQSKEILDLAMEKRNTDVLGILLNWDKRGRDEAVDAQRLIEMPLEEAANWIDLHLPPPPNAEHLTGCDDPPARPSHLPSPPFETRPASLPAPSTPELPLLPSKPFLPESPEQIPTAPANMRSSPSWQDARSGSPPPARPASPRKRFVGTSLSNWTSSQALQHSQPPSQLPHAANARARLNLSHLPVGFDQGEFEGLFSKINVQPQVVLYCVNYTPTYAFVDVDKKAATHTILELNGLQIGGHFLRAIFATSQSRRTAASQDSSTSFRPSRISPSLVQPPTAPRAHSDPSHPTSLDQKHLSRSHPYRRPSNFRGSIESDSTSTPYTNTRLLFNLPLTDFSRLSRVAHLLKGNQIIKYPEFDQSVMIALTVSRAAADRFDNLWDDYLLDGKRLKVVRVKVGVEPRDVIEGYFRHASSGSAHTASNSQRSSTASQRSRSRSVSPQRRRM